MDTRNVSTVTLRDSDEIVVYVGSQRWVVRTGGTGIEVEAHVLVSPPVLEDDATVTVGRPPTPMYRSADMRISPRRRNASPRLLIEAVEEEGK